MSDPAEEKSLLVSSVEQNIPAKPDVLTVERMLGKTGTSAPSGDASSTRSDSSFDRLRNEFERGETLRALTVVIPMYRESKRIAKTIETLAKSKVHRDGIAFCFVDDGSTDDTVAVATAAIAKFRLSNAEVLKLPQNLGKGGAVRAGILHSAGESHIVGYLDADLSLDPSELLTAVARIRMSKCDALVGERIVDSARQPKMRRVASLVFRRVATSMVPTGVRDTQCAMKLFRSEVAIAVFTPLSTNGFAFDVEILGRLKRDCYVVRECPVLWEHQDGSQIATGADGFKMVRELVSIRSVLRSGATAKPQTVPAEL